MLGDLPISALVSFVWWYAIRDADEKERKKFETKLWRPPAKNMVIPAQSPWSAEAEMNAFQALRMETSGNATHAARAMKPS